jgi:hypothetical protein
MHISASCQDAPGRDRRISGVYHPTLKLFHLTSGHDHVFMNTRRLYESRPTVIDACSAQLPHGSHDAEI